MSPPRLLSVSEAAERLGVHVGTVRRWTDGEVLPEIRTPGGHRRIPADAVELLCRQRTASADPPEGSVNDGSGMVEVAPADQAWADHAVVHARYKVQSSEGEPWNEALSADARQHRRETGRQLVGLLLHHVSGQGDPDARGAETRRLAWGYALEMKDLGLPLSEALRATLFFRDVFTESAAYYPRFEEKEAVDQIALMRRVNGFMNEVQMTIARAYESDGSNPEVEA